MVKRLSLMALLVVIVSACNSNIPISANTPEASENNPAPTNTPVLLSTPIPTPSPLPPTHTAIPPSATPTATATPLPQPYGPDNFPDNVNPLTGLQVSDESILDRRPLAVKIQIYPRGQRPPWGVTKADIVYDYYQNGGLTRLIAVFYGQDAEQVGPIRSGRLFDANVVNMYKAIFAFGGADRRILNRLYSSGFSDRIVVEGARNCPPMCRIEPNTFNYLVTNTEELGKFAEANGVKNERQNLDGMRFDPQTPQGGNPGTQVYTRYSISAYNRWDYNPATRRYLRFQDNQEDNGQGEVYVPLVDRLDDQQVAADNVVILFAQHQDIVRSANAEIIEITLIGSGSAYAFRDGKVYQVKWSRADQDSLVKLTLADGSEYAFKPGTTWYQVVGQSSKIDTSQPGILRFTSSIP